MPIPDVINDNGSVAIFTYHMDSSGSYIPPVIARVLSKMANASLNQLDGGLQNNKTYKNAISLISEKYIRFEDCVPVNCPRQTDSYSCGYHAVFKIIRMHLAKNINALSKSNKVPVQQDDKEISIQQFIANQKIKLQQRFNNQIANNINAAPSLSNEILTNFATAKMYTEELFLFKGYNHIEKLEKLIEIEKFIRAGGQDSITNVLSKLKIEEIYKKILMNFVTSIKYDFSHLDIRLEPEDEVLFQILLLPNTAQNPKPHISSMMQLQQKLINCKKAILAADEIGNSIFNCQLYYPPFFKREHKKRENNIQSNAEYDSPNNKKLAL